MSRFNVGDIIINKWASDRNPLRKSMYIGFGFVIAYYQGRFHKTTFIDEADKDTLPPFENGERVVCVDIGYHQCIPYNDDTKHLVGTLNDCPEYYKWWEE